MNTLLAVATLGGLLALAAPAGSPLLLASGPQVEFRGEGDEGSFSYEKGMAQADAVTLIQQVRKHIGPARAILRVPGRGASFLVVGLGRVTTDPEDFGGLRLMLVEKSGRSVTLLAQSSGSADSYSLKPVVFTGGGRTIVLAETGTEYSWGLRVFEVVGRELRDLGGIDAGVIGESGQEEDPTPFARVTIAGGKVVITFDSDLSIGTGNPGARLALKPVVFRQSATGFTLEQPRFKPVAPPAR
jgi:hypothetical protein